MADSSDVTIRHGLRPGDLGAVIKLHGDLYDREYGFNLEFEAYVAEGLARFALNRSNADRIWLAERDDRLVGCIAIVRASPTEAQLRWYLVDPVERGTGLGRRLLADALGFVRGQGYRSVFLWTVSTLAAAAHLYRSVGFEKVEEKAGRWGVEVVQEKYVMDVAQ